MSDTAKSPEPTSDDPKFLRADIEVTRNELADSVAELAHKVNVPKRAREQVDHLEQVVHDKLPAPVNGWAGKVIDTIGHRPAVATAAVVGAFIALRLVRRFRWRR